MWLMFLLSVFVGIFGQRRTAQQAFYQNARVFHGAPGGTDILEIDPDALQQGPAAIAALAAADIRIKLAGRDKKHFALVAHVLQASRPMDRAIGRTYNVSVEARSKTQRGLVYAALYITVKVVKRNEHAPIFMQDSFTAEVYRYAAIGTAVLRVLATDQDALQYEEEDSESEDDELLGDDGGIDYSLAPGRGGDYAASFFSIGSSSGVISTRAALDAIQAVVHLQVVATDRGLPPMTVTSGATIILRDISEPTKLSIQILEETLAELCWGAPSSGRPQRYLLTYAPSEQSDLTRDVPVTQSASDINCHNLSALEPHAEYWAQVRAHDEGKSGVLARIWFRTEHDACASSPCPVGMCIIRDSDPGYYCLCDEQDAACASSDATICTNGSCVHDPDGQLADSADDARDRDCVHGVGQCGASFSCSNGGTLWRDAGVQRCRCNDDFTGNSCQYLSYCDDMTCGRHGHCNRVSSPAHMAENYDYRRQNGVSRGSGAAYLCHCVPGWYGTNCRQFDACSLGPCENEGICFNTTSALDGYTCTCSPGFFGRNCTRYDPCSSSPCQNHGRCSNVTDLHYQCDCRPGYHGYDCDEYSPCADEPCLNGGMCNSVDGRYICDCGLGYTGRHCENVNVCELQTPCGPHSERCQNQRINDYFCVCHEGYSGKNCTQFDPCFDEPCLHDGTCRMLSENDFRCDCRGAYYGRYCEKQNACYTTTSGGADLEPVCRNGGVCYNTTEGGDYECRCRVGFYGSRCERYNPCAKNMCNNGARCVNTSENAYWCVCEGAYFGDFCQFFNSCHSSPCQNGRCISLQTGEYRCECRTGFYGPDCQYAVPCPPGSRDDGVSSPSRDCSCEPGYHGHSCELYDACQSSPCAVGSCVTQSDGRFRCSCPRDLFGPTCNNTDPCAGSPCRNHATCISTYGSTFICQCSRGYYGSRCEHFNSCISNPCFNNGVCHHTSDSEFDCECREGFQGSHCQSPVPCDMRTRCLNGGTCIEPEQGSGDVVCLCPHGYLGERCQLFNPCASAPPCKNGGSCTPSSDSLGYECRCPIGFFGMHCELHSTCMEFICKNKGTCVRTVGGDICRCADGYTGETCEYDIDECQDRRICHHGGKCINNAGSYRCVCPTGYEGNQCQNRALCHEDYMYDSSGLYIWPRTPHGHQTELRCPLRPSENATRRCTLSRSGRSIWDDPDLRKCYKIISTVPDALTLTSPYQKQTFSFQSKEQVSTAVNISENILSVAYRNTPVAREIMSMINRMLEADVSIMSSNSTSRVLQLLDTYLSQVSVSDSSLNLTYSNLHVLAQTIPPEDARSNDIVYQSYFNQDGSFVQLTLPAEALRTSGKIYFTHFRNSKLFQTTSIEDSSHDMMDASDWMTTHNVGDVIGATVSGVDIENLETCVVYKMKKSRAPSTAHRSCAYWDIYTQSWQTRGIETVVSHMSDLQCCSKHLTYFASIKGMAMSSSTIDDQITLFILSFIGTGFTIFLLFFVLLSYSMFRILNRDTYGQLVLQLCGTLLLFDVSLLLGFNRNRIGNQIICQIVAILHHFMSISSLVWMTLIGIHVYQALARDFVVKEKCFLLKRIIVAWGIPLVCVSVAVSLDMSLYEGHGDRCFVWPTDTRLLYCGTFLAPACLFIFINMVLSGFVASAMCSKKLRTKTPPVSPKEAFGTILVITLLSTVCILSYLAEREDKSLLYGGSTDDQLDGEAPALLSELEMFRFQFAFYTSNIILGIVAVLVYCLCRRDARLSWMKLCRCAPTSIGHSQRRSAGKAALVGNGNSNGTGNGNRNLQANNTATNVVPATLKADSGSEYTLVVDRRHSGKTFMTEEEDKLYEHPPCASQATGQRLAHHTRHPDPQELHQSATPPPSPPSASTSSWLHQQQQPPHSYQPPQQHYHTIGGRGHKQQAQPMEYQSATTSGTLRSAPSGYSTGNIAVHSSGTMPRSSGRGNNNSDWMNHTKV